MKVAVVGSRDFTNPLLAQALVRAALLREAKRFPEPTIISGGARGVDTWAREEAEYIGLAFEECPADWEKYGKRSGFVRNEEIVKAADRVIAVWNGESKGTKNDIDLALRYHKNLEVIFP